MSPALESIAWRALLFVVATGATSSLAATTASAAEPTQAVGVELDPGQAWSRQHADAPASARFVHDATETTVELVMLDAGPAPDDPSQPAPLVDATAALDDWLTQLAEQDPRVDASPREPRVVDLGGGEPELRVELVRIALDFESRTAVVLGFTSRSLAAARGEQLDTAHDRYAWIVLLETHATHRDALADLEATALAGLRVTGP